MTTLQFILTGHEIPSIWKNNNEAATVVLLTDFFTVYTEFQIRCQFQFRIYFCAETVHVETKDD